MDNNTDKCYGCEHKLGLTRLVVRADGMEQHWHLGCYNAVQQVLTLEKLEEDDGEETSSIYSG